MVGYYSIYSATWPIGFPCMIIFNLADRVSLYDYFQLEEVKILLNVELGNA